jgi:MoxR-like ATPase
MASGDTRPPGWIPRLLDLPALLSQRSHFLLGPRQTGKTSLIRATLRDARVYDTAVEVKAKESVSPQDLKSLRALAEEKQLKRYLCVCLEPRARRTDGISVLPLERFLDALWNDEYR